MLSNLKAANPAAEPALVLGDLSLIAGMKATGAALAEQAPVVDVLVNNAGAFFEKREVTADGLEKTFAVNHMAYFVITELLRPHLRAGCPGGKHRLRRPHLRQARLRRSPDGQAATAALAWRRTASPS